MTRRSWRWTWSARAAALTAASQQVPVDGELVVGVALRPAPHRLPLGEDADQQVALVERLQHPDGRATGQEQVGQQATGALGPRIWEDRDLGGQAVERPAARCGRRAAAAATATRRTRAGKSFGSASASRWTSPSRSTTPGPTWRSERASRPVGPASEDWVRLPGLVGDPGDRAGRLGHVGHQQVGVLVAQGLGDRGPAPGARAGRCCRPVRRWSSTRTASRTSPAAARASGSPLASWGRAASDQPRAWTSRRPPRPSFRSGSRRKATSPCWRWRSRTELASSPSQRFDRLRHRATASVGQLLGERDVARQVAGDEERGGRVEVGRREGQRLLDRAHRVAQLQAGVPDRVPEALRGLRRPSASGWCSRRRSRSLPGASSPRP